MSTSNDESTSQQELRLTFEKQKAKREPKASKLSIKEESVLNDGLSSKQESRPTRRKKQKAKAEASKSRSKNENPLEHESRSVKGKKQNPKRKMKDDNSRVKRPRKKKNIKQENENSPQVEAGKKTF